jgi:hypothetical protein
MDCNFKKDQLGKMVFYPWSYLAHGRILDGPEKEARLRAGLKAHKTVWFIVLMVLIALQKNYYIFALSGALAMMVSYQLTCNNLLAGCQESPEPLTFRQSQAVVASQVGMKRLALSLFFSLFMVLLGGWQFFMKAGLRARVMGTLCVLIFSGLAANAVYLLRFKAQAGKKAA